MNKDNEVSRRTALIAAGGTIAAGAVIVSTLPTGGAWAVPVIRAVVGTPTASASMPAPTLVWVPSTLPVYRQSGHPENHSYLSLTIPDGYPDIESVEIKIRASDDVWNYSAGTNDHLPGWTIKFVSPNSDPLNLSTILLQSGFVAAPSAFSWKFVFFPFEDNPSVVKQYMTTLTINGVSVGAPQLLNLVAP